MSTVTETYEQTRQRHVQRFGEFMLAAVARLELPADALATHRTERLRETIAYAKAHSPWHRERLAGVDPDTVTEADLVRVEPMTKDDLMANFDAIVTDDRVTLDAVEQHIAGLTSDAYFQGYLHAVASGGSSGRRGVFVWGWDAWAEGYAAGPRYLAQAMMRDPDGLGVPGPMATVTAGNAMHITVAMSQTFSEVVSFPITSPLAEVVAGLNRVQPRVLFGYASAICELLEEVRAGRLEIQPAAVIQAGEPLLPQVRQAIADTWGARVANIWGTSEFGGTGSGCLYGDGIHLHDDLLVYEFIDEDGRPVTPGERAAKAFITNLYNPVMPLIRYELTDEVVLVDGPCPCGSAHRRVADIQGRLDDGFIYQDGSRVHPHVFRSALTRTRGVTEYRVLQTADGATVEIRAGSEVDVADLAARLTDGVRSAGVPNAHVVVARVDSFPRTETGKVRRFVPLG